MPQAFNVCPGCGLNMGQRKEPVGRPYRCRRCKAVIVHAEKHPSGDSLFVLRVGERGDPNLMTIPRV